VYVTWGLFFETWALLLRWAFDLDVLRCPRCAGRMQIIATVVAGLSAL